MNLQETIRRILREDIEDHKPLEGLFSIYLNNELTTGKVKDLVKYSKKYPTINLSLNDIPDIPHHQDPETNIYVMNADLKYPIILAVNENNEITRVLDGNHRIQKALYLGNNSIRAKLIPEEDIIKLLDKTNIQETIRRILREELSVKVRRRVPVDEMEEEFLESFEMAYVITKNRQVLSKHFLDELIYTTISVMMDGVHWRFVSTLPEDEFWYDEMHSELENHYRDRIIQMYNERRGINESILTEDSKVKTLVDKVGLTQGNAIELDRLCGSLSVWMANKLINHQQGINTSWNKTDENGLETLNDRGIQRFRSLITSIMDWIRIGLNGNLGDKKNLTFSDLAIKSQEWHNSLNIGDGDINYVEKNPIILDFRDENGNGFYWVDLETSNSSEECERMGHCGRSSFGNLYSLREFRPLNEKYKLNKSHLTASIGSDGILYQLKGSKNSKPKEELHGYITPLFFVLGGAGEEDDYLIQGFGSEYASQKDFKLSDLSDEVIKDLYRNRPELFNTRGLQRKLAELGYIELPEINYNVKIDIDTEGLSNYVDGDYVISRRKVKRTTPGGTEYEQTIERTLFEDILTGETWDLYEPGEVDWKSIVEYSLNESNIEKIRDILLKVASKTEDFNQEDFDEESLENLIEEYDDDYEIRNSISNAGESMERSEYYDYLYKELKSSLEEYGSIEKMDDTGVTLNVNVKPYLEDHDEDIIDEILDECNDDYSCVFRYLVREEMIIDRPKFETNDYWTPDVDNNDFNELVSDYLSDAERAYSK